MKILSMIWLLIAITSTLSGCSGMAQRAQIKVAIEQVEWRGESNQFDTEAKQQLARWLTPYAISELRLKLDAKNSNYLAIKKYLLARGVSPQQLETFADDISLPTNNIFIAGILIKRSIPQCPSWVTPNMADSKVSQSSNFGCASERNLAIMVADSSDLIRGKKLAGASAEHSINALNRYYRRNTEQTEPVAAPEPLELPIITGSN